MEQRRAIDLEELAARADFFSRMLFGIPFGGIIAVYDPGALSDTDLHEYNQKHFWGMFCSEWEEGRTPRQKCDSSLSPPGGRCMRRKRCAGKEECTKPEIWLNAKLFERSIIFLDNILIHELCHYACWYYGWEMEDGSTQFENLLKKTGASSNSGNRWDAKNKVYIPVYDGRRMKHYEYMFMTYRRTGKSPPCAHLSVVS